MKSVLIRITVDIELDQTKPLLVRTSFRFMILVLI